MSSYLPKYKRLIPFCQIRVRVPSKRDESGVAPSGSCRLHDPFAARRYELIMTQCLNRVGQDMAFADSPTKKMTNTYPAKAAVRRNKRALSQASSKGGIWHREKQIAALDLSTLNELWFITWDPTEPIATRPLNGRWTRLDPIEIEGGTNLYMYTYNSPLLYVDALGQNSSNGDICCKDGQEVEKVTDDANRKC